MIIGGSKKEVISNIKKNIEDKEYNKKVEVNDAVLTDEQIDEYLNRFYKQKKSLSYKLKNKAVLKGIYKTGKDILNSINVVGEDNLRDLDLSKGAIITCNHFNPLDSYNVRKVVEEILHKKLYIVIEETNLAMPGELGLIMNYANTIPITKKPNYILKTFIPEIKKALNEGNIVLIYPEEEMWFNYKKPRPCKRGAYQFASQLNVPVISLFVQIDNLDTKDNDEFLNTKQTVHILKTIYPDNSKSIKENSIIMADTDYNQKKEAYEKAYNKKLSYDFSYDDIAGFIAGE